MGKLREQIRQQSITLNMNEWMQKKEDRKSQDKDDDTESPQNDIIVIR